MREFSVSVKSWVCKFLIPWLKNETPVALMYFNVVLNFGNLMSDFSICCLYQAGTQQGTQREGQGNTSYATEEAQLCGRL